VKAHLDLVRAADENFIVSFRKVTQHIPESETRESESIFSFSTGLPISLFNGCVVTEEATPSELGAALEWVVARDVAFRVWVAEKLVAGLAEVPTRYGLTRAASVYPGMVLHPLRDAPENSQGVTVVPVHRGNLGEFLDVLEAGGLSPTLAQRLFSLSFVGDPDVQLFVGVLDGMPVGTSLAIRSRQASGVYNVGTLPSARRRGVGSALTWAAVEAGRAWGYDTIVLQSSPMALSMYSEMGFRTVAPYVEFGKPASS
jgi:ribosomal protein S18 acetylase RimI-like enzyme